MESLIKLINFIIFLLLFIGVLVSKDFFNSSTFYKKKEIFYDAILVKKELIKNPERKIISNKLKLHKKEWFPFKDFKYKLNKQKWSQSNKVLFTNILFRESGGTVTSKHKEIDQYLVAITAMRRYIGKNYTSPVIIKKYNKNFKRYKSQAVKITKKYYHVPKFVGAYSMASLKKPVFKGGTKVINEKAWQQCYKVVNDVLEGTIPDFVPYVPHGTYAYLNSRIDTDMDWINSVTKKWVVVASTVKDHHYYADPEEMTKEEIEHLKKGPINPKNTRFEDGLFASLIK
jgi:hypothetical protein